MPLLGTRGAASARGFGFGGVVAAPPGQQAYTTAGTYSWVAPAGVTSVSVVAVGGAKGSGGGLGYKNNIPVVPGNSYTVVVGVGRPVLCGTNPGGDSYFINTSTVKGGGAPNGFYGVLGGTYTGDGGGNGGSGGGSSTSYQWSGGGAGGYSGNGGNGTGCTYSTTGNSNPGSGGSGGAGGSWQPNSPPRGGGGGGGVGILGQGSSGARVGVGAGGNGGSGGGNGGCGSGCYCSCRWCGGSGGTYGGGAGHGAGTGSTSGTGGGGAVRIIWPGTTRQFPSTNTGNL